MNSRLRAKQAPSSRADGRAAATTLARVSADSPIRILVRLLSERKGLFAGNLALRLIKDLLPFLGPILVGMAVDLLSGASGRDRNLFGIELTQNDVRSIVIVAVFMAALAVGKAVFGYVHTIVAAHMGRHVVQAARRDLANAAMEMSLDHRRRFNSGDLLDRCLADSKGLRSFTQNVVIRVISNTVRAIFPVVFMFSIDPVLAVVVLAVIPLQSSVSAMLQRRLQRQTREARSREALHTSAVKEAIDERGWNNVASVGGQSWAAQEMHVTAAASEDAKLVKKHTTASISAVISLCTALGIATVYAIGGWRIISSGVLDGTAAEGALTLGTLTAFIGVAKKTYAPFQAYTKIVSSYRTGLVNLERIADVLDAPTIDPRHNGPNLQVRTGTIEVDDVTFTYEDGQRPTLRELTGSIPGRSLTVITGSSGAGKTTLLRLLLGLDIPTRGTVSIDGQDINKAKLASVQDAIVLVPQEPVLFSGTMLENLLLGLDDVPAAAVLIACDRAGLMDTIERLPAGLETKVGSGKHMLSGGQLRRMAIARALLREPQVLLLDEPTTGLDVENSRRVLDTLRTISEHTTVVMVSHRSEPLLASDHHLLLHEGAWQRTSRAGKTAPFAAATQTLPSNGNGAHTSPEANDSLDVSNGQATTNDTSDTGSNGHRSVHDRRHQPIAPHIVGATTDGISIEMRGLDSHREATRILAVSGHRPGVGTAGEIIAAAATKLRNTAVDDVALAWIEDLDADRTAAVRLDQDHLELKAKQTQALHQAINAWHATVVLDIAQHVGSDSSGEHHVHLVVRFRPDANQQPAPEIVALATRLRQRLDHSAFSYRVSMVGCLPGTLAAERDVTVVEVTSLRPQDLQVVQAMIEATEAAYTAVVTESAKPATV